MKFSKLQSILSDYAQAILNTNESNARFRYRAYRRVIDLINKQYSPRENVTDKKIRDLCLTKYMTNNLLNVMNGGTLPKLNIVTQSKLYNDLIGIMGIGKEKARKLIEKGLTSVSQLKTKKWVKELPEETRMYISMSPSKSIPHAEITKLQPIITGFSNTNRKLYIVGSYRRKAKVSKDIDVMLVSSDSNAIDKLLKDMQKTLDVYPYAQGKDKMSLVIKISKRRAYKIDIFRVLPKYQIPMMLYATGSKTHNIKMRRIAKRLGYKLNQKGLFRGNKRIEGLKKESDYFKILGMKYIPPEDRI